MKLSRNFDSKEFVCPCCNKVNITPNLVIKLQQLRDNIGEPIYITSGVRCKAYNKKIGGYKNSPHLEGLAADIQIKDMSEKWTFIYIVNKLEEIRLGIYPNHLHIDIVPPHPSKYWLVKKYGKKPVYSGKQKDLIKFLKKEVK